MKYVGVEVPTIVVIDKNLAHSFYCHTHKDAEDLLAAIEMMGHDSDVKQLRP